MRRWQLVIDDTGSVEGIYAFIYCTKWRSGRVSRMPHWLTDWLTTLKDSATQLLINYKSGALVTQQGPKINVRDLYQGQVGFVIFLWMLWTKNFDENWRPFARSVLTTRLGLRHPMALVMARFSLRTPSICHTTAFTIIRAAHNAIFIIFELNRVFR